MRTRTKVEKEAVMDEFDLTTQRKGAVMDEFDAATQRKGMVMEELVAASPLEVFKQKAEETRKRVEKRLTAKNHQIQESIKVLEVVDKKLDKKNGSKVTIIDKGYGRFMVDDKEVIVNRDIGMNQLVEVIDLVPAYSRSEVIKNIEQRVYLQFSSTTE